MPTQVRALVIAVVVVLFAHDARAESARPSEVVWPQLSYSVAVGKSDGQWLGHMWIGAGLHLGPRTRTLSGLFLLTGVELDLRDRSDARLERSTRTVSSSDESGAEAWLALRVGVGLFRERALAPYVATYAIFARRVAGPDAAPTSRFGVGLSIPAALPLARIGVPTMIEGGIDGGGAASDLHGFVRAGWNF